MKTKIKLFDPFIDESEKKALQKVLKSHFWAYGGGKGFVLEFEKKFRYYIKSKECISVNSGTAALHLALSLFNIRGYEVILPSLSFVSTAHAVKYNGGIPIFAEIDPTTLCLDPDSIKKTISLKTKVILPVHFGGMPSKLDEITEICNENNISLVEDAAHACGSTYNKRKIGTHGRAVCFSFHPIKNLAMPSGGAITLNGSDHRKSADELKSKRWCGITNRKGTIYDVDKLGWNYYMNEFSAAIGLSQLKKLDKMNRIRKKIAVRYSKEIIVEGKTIFDKDCSYHIYWILVKNRDFFIKKLLEVGIETGIHYHPIHKMNYYNNNMALPTTEKISKQIVSLPIHPNLSYSDVDLVIKYTNKFAK